MSTGISFRNLFTLTFGAIIGVGWITVLGAWLDTAGSLGALLAFLLGGLAISLVAICYAEIASALPEEGGEILYASRVFGPFSGLMTGWFLALAFLTVCGFEALSVGWIVVVILPALKGQPLYQVFGETIYIGELIVSTAMIGFITFLQIRGTKTATRFQDLMTFGLIAVIVLFFVASIGSANLANLQPIFAKPGPLAAGGGVLALLATTPFWFAGFNIMPQALADRDAGLSLHRLGPFMVIVILCASLFYCGLILSASLIAERDVLSSAELPAAYAFEAAFGSPIWAKAALVTGFLGLLTSWNAVALASSHVLHALAQRGALHSRLGKGDPKTGYPVITLIAFITLIMTLMGKGAIAPIVNILGVIFAGMYILTCVAFIKLRMSEPELKRPYRTPVGLIIAPGAIAIAVGMVVSGLYGPVVSARGAIPVELIVLGVWSIISIWVSLAVTRKKPPISAN